MSPAAAERKAERRRQWNYAHRERVNARNQAKAEAKLADAWGYDDRWIIVTCPGCQGLFDIPRVGGKRYTHCPECR